MIQDISMLRVRSASASSRDTLRYAPFSSGAPTATCMHVEALLDGTEGWKGTLSPGLTIPGGAVRMRPFSANLGLSFAASFVPAVYPAPLRKLHTWMSPLVMSGSFKVSHPEVLVPTNASPVSRWPLQSGRSLYALGSRICSLSRQPPMELDFLIALIAQLLSPLKGLVASPAGTSQSVRLLPMPHEGFCPTAHVGPSVNPWSVSPLHIGCSANSAFLHCEGGGRGVPIV
mmetsp:Transcript_37125/g.62491  ORF Transcript_37125/g.62491 Transcript_37125/m.62491 type:complete len:230 (+) Transcript_37125:675-1364(+)